MSATQITAPSTGDEAAGGGPFARLRRKPRGSRSSAPLAPLSPARAAAVVTFATLTLLAVWFVLYALLFSGLEEGHTQHVLYTELRPGLASETVPFGGVIAPGTPVALITAASINLRSVVVEGTSSKDLTKGPGHYPSSPFPGQAGVAVLFGRSATFGSPFAKIGSLQPGALVAVTTGQGRFVFKVNDVRHPGDPLPAVLPANASALTLVTSTGSGWRGGWAPTQVVYVDASLVAGKVQAAPPGRPTVVATRDGALASDTSDLVPLVLWLQATLLVVAGLIYARGKVSPWQLWVMGLPVVIAVLWGTSSTALMLLPNLA